MGSGKYRRYLTVTDRERSSCDPRHSWRDDTSRRARARVRLVLFYRNFTMRCDIEPSHRSRVSRLEHFWFPLAYYTCPGNDDVRLVDGPLAGSRAGVVRETRVYPRLFPTHVDDKFK